jgi:hypothetical protein
MPIEMSLEDYHALIKRPKGPPRYVPSEASEQIALFDWIDTLIPREPRLELAFHVPNGEHREIAVGVKLKAMGVRPGVPDVLLPVACRGWIGLAIELKVGTNTMRPEQAIWRDRLLIAGWHHELHYSWVAAARCLSWYLDRSWGEMGLEGVTR